MDRPVTPFPEQRGAVRVDVRLGAEVISDWGEPEAAEISNLSQTGLRLEGGMALVALVTPNCCRVPGSERLAVEVRFWIDGPGGEEAVVVRGQSVYVRRVGWDHFQVGLEYRQIDDLSEKRLERFIRALLSRRSARPRP